HCSEKPICGQKNSQKKCRRWEFVSRWVGLPTVTLDDVKDIETLRRAAKILEAEVQELVKTVTQLKRRVFELEHGKPEQLELLKVIDDLEEQLARRNKLLFGESTEKRPSDKAKKPSSKKQTGHGRRDQPDLEVIEQVHVTN